MRLVTFRTGSGPARAGALAENDTRVVDLQHAHRARFKATSPQLDSVLAVIEGGANALDLATETVRNAPEDAVVARPTVTLDAPVPAPPQMRDFLCFEKHLLQSFAAVRRLRAGQTGEPEPQGAVQVPQVWYERPVFYHPNRLNVVGTDHDVVWPDYSRMIDFELEFGCFIGPGGRDIAREKAREHIFGYTIFNDFSARDEQTLDMAGQLGPGKGKDFDRGNVMGPCLVTADEIGDPYRLDMIARVNGAEWGRGNSREMHWKFEDCIAHISRGETLHPGEFFGSGTVGNGCGLEHLRFLSPRDVVELEVEKIGVLRSRVVRRG
jgi:2-keto-4-pentenoate hydratase/2-oxohepta-3-ene-1,7-dioic acid hydratase in catechol pathway